MNYFPVGGRKQKFRRVVTNLYYDLPQPPFSDTSGCAVVLNNEIHVIVKTKHYKWDGTKWIFVSVFPYSFQSGGAVVFNNEIHIFGGSDSSTNTKHYKWDGETWTEVEVLPFQFYYSNVVVYNDEIHVIGGHTAIHYKWDGETWTSIEGTPYNCDQGAICVLNDEIHIMGGYGGITKHYKWDGNTWTFVVSLPFGVNQSDSGFAITMNGCIYLLFLDKRAVFDGSSWSVSNFKYDSHYVTAYNTEYAPHTTYGSQVAVLDDGIHIINIRERTSSGYESHAMHAVENVNIYIPIN